VRREAQAGGAGGLRLYVDTTNTRAQAVYEAMGMNGGHYRVFEEMFS
jgi:ribosomal protein S18 acetylase RimI-like enzyme